MLDRHLVSGVCWIAAGGALFLGVCPAAPGQCQYDVAIITLPKCPPFGVPPALAESLNNAGDVVGYYPSCLIGPDQPFLWTMETGLTTIALPPGASNGRAYDIADCGWIAGTMGGVTAPRRGFLVNDDGLVDLGTLAGGTFSEALALNEVGQIVGYWGNTQTGPGALAFLWQDDVMIDLSPDLGTPVSLAYDINDNGAITGWMGSSSLYDAHAYVWENSAVTDLGPIPGGFTSEGRAINNRGHVAGTGRSTEGETVVRHAFFWSDGAMTDLGILPGMAQSLAYGLNDADQVVGFCKSVGQWPIAFIWQHAVMTSLNSLVPSPEVFVEGARAINNEGQISGWGHTASASVAFLLTPMDRPLGDVDIDCQVGVLDLLIVLGSWGPCNDCITDLDSDGVVDVVDLLLVLTNWG